MLLNKMAPIVPKRSAIDQKTLHKNSDKIKTNKKLRRN
jgi:hypothetical protein